MLRDSMPSKAPASAAQDMTRWKGGVPGTMMFTMKVKGAVLALHAHTSSGMSREQHHKCLAWSCREPYARTCYSCTSLCCCSG